MSCNCNSCRKKNNCCKYKNYKHNCCNSHCYNPCPPIPPVPPVPPKPIEKKAIALLEDIKSESGDLYVVESLYFSWYQDSSFPKFPIIETDGTVENNIELLNKYYNEGYRYFLGFSRSTIVEGVLQWFLEHPDTIGISINSGAQSLTVPKNIYRMTTPLISVIPTLENLSLNANNVYYIYNQDELISQDLKKLLELNPLIKDKLKLYPIVNDLSYNVSDLSNFLSGSSSNDIIFLGIFEPELYSDLYNNGLLFDGNQYTVVGILLNVNDFIEPCKSILDKKYFNIGNIFTNTSLLYRENEEYLIKKYGTDADVGNVQNAIKMIQYFLLNKNIDYLGSYNGTLQFDINKDLKYSSYLIEQYIKEINGFRKYSIFFDDPLLGKFEANFTN